MSEPATPLFLHEEIMLLALRNDKGTPEFGSMYAYALGGAILANLLLAGRISIHDDKRKLVDPLDDAPLCDSVIDECLEKITSAKRRAAAATWVQRFASLRKLHHRVAEGLCQRGILRGDEDKVLLIFNRKIYPELDPKPERKLIERIRKAVFTETPTVDARTSLLVTLANSVHLLDTPFGKQELKRRKERLKQLANGDLVGKATSDAVVAAQMAAASGVFVACIMPAITASAVSH